MLNNASSCHGLEMVYLKDYLLWSGFFLRVGGVGGWVGGGGGYEDRSRSSRLYS